MLVAALLAAFLLEGKWNRSGFPGGPAGPSAARPAVPAHPRDAPCPSGEPSDMLPAVVVGLSPTGEDVILKAEGHEKPYLAMRIPALTGASIASGVAREKPPRPYAHDLFVELLRLAGLRVLSVDVVDLREGVYIAVLRVEKGGRVARMDARPSDAIAIASRLGAPVRVSARLLDRSGFAVEEGPGRDAEEPPAGIIRESRREM